MKRIIILGSTGSIGRQTLEVISENSTLFKVVGLSCDKNVDLIYDQIQKFHPEYVAIRDCESARKLKERLKDKNIKVLVGEDGVNELATFDADLLVLSIVGTSAIMPLIKSLTSKKDIALANKEVLVCAGQYVMNEIKRNKINLYPIDSEHSALWKCLDFDFNKTYKKLIITASGGAFRDLSYDELKHVKAKDALKHPTWNMGNKITIDSATLMNKGFEVIEAFHLFNASVDKIDVVVHKESIIHSMVEFEDNTIKAEMSYPDMKIPIQLAITYPNYVLKNKCRSIDFKTLKSLSFDVPNEDKFECLKIAKEVVKEGGLLSCMVCSANDVLVDYYLKDKISFLDIPKNINIVLDKLANLDNKNYSIEEVFEVRKRTKDFVKSILN